MRLKIPPKVERIINVLETHGFEAYAVGGCVRDSILNRVPDDWDITTSAQPEEVKKLFYHTVDTGILHGTVTVMLGRDGFEVTTYRLDGKYEDGRHPKEVTYTASLKEDLKRRDFTINAMAYNPSEGLVDLFGGMEDLQRKVIRCVGNPEERFREDALRILRAVRFSAQLGFDILPETRRALRALAPNLRLISAERIQTELVKILVSPHPEYLKIAWEEKITKEILPEFDVLMETPQNTPHHCMSAGEHTLKSMEEIPPLKALRLTMLLHDMGKGVCRTTDENGRDHFKGHGKFSEEIARDILKRLKFDNDTLYRVCRLVKWHDYRPEPTSKAVRKAVNKIGPDLFEDYLLVQKADALAQSEYKQEEKLLRIREVEGLFREIQREKQCVSLEELAVSGKDLIALGMKPGREMGILLHELLEMVLEEPAKNEKEFLKEQVKKRLKEN